MEQIIRASSLPVLVDGDDGYGDAKNVTRTVEGYERIGASAIFIEDQQAPKRCGHMADKKVVPVEEMTQKVKAAVAARRNKDFYILARTDARAPHGLDDAIKRAEAYLEAGADGAYIEGPETVEELRRIGEKLKGAQLATSILERGGKTPFVPPAQMGELGFSMILYPTTVLFSVTRVIERSLEALRLGQELNPTESVDMDEFENIVNIDFWKDIEHRFMDVEHAGGPVGWLKHAVGQD
jgi:2-methylisocitrate lyase-like PEP mutase family enzyme